MANKGPQTAKPLKNYHAVALGEKGGVVGGPARAKVLSAARRREIAAQGGRASAGSRKS